MTRMLFGLAALCSVLANVPTAHAEDDLGMQLRISATKDCSKETLPAARADCQTSKIMALDAYGHRQGIKASCNTGLSSARNCSELLQDLDEVIEESLFGKKPGTGGH
jgi:hypothetical protein